MRCAISSVILLVVCVASAPHNAAASVLGEWNFNNNLTASYGSATMSLWNSTAVTYEDAAINGVHKTVLNYGAFGPTEGLKVATGASSNYTMIWDLLLPTTTNVYSALYQTNLDNADDATLCMRRVNKTSMSSFEVGTGGEYYGNAAFDAWHRIAVTVAATNDGTGSHVVNSYIDGAQVASDHTYTVGQSRMDISSGFLLFADNDGETSPGKLSMFYLADRVMSSAEIVALGGPSAAGIAVPEPSTCTAILTGVAALLAYAWRKRKV